MIRSEVEDEVAVTSCERLLITTMAKKLYRRPRYGYESRIRSGTVCFLIRQGKTSSAGAADSDLISVYFEKSGAQGQPCPVKDALPPFIKLD